MGIRILLIAILFSNVAICGAQTCSIEDNLRSFLIKAGELDKSSQADLLVRHILDCSKFDSTKDGIYKFSVFASHAMPYLFLYEDRHMHIIQDYSVVNVMKEIAQYFERNDAVLDKATKIKYLEKVVEVVKNNDLPSGWERLPANFQFPDILKQ